MPGWLVVYLAIFVILSIAGHWSDISDKKPFWYLGFGVFSDLTITFLFIAFWLPSIRVSVGWIAPIAYVASMSWEIYQAVEDSRYLNAERNDDPEFKERQERLLEIITYIVFAAICLPAFLVAGISAFRF